MRPLVIPLLLTCAAVAVDAADIAVTAQWQQGVWVTRAEPLELELSRAPTAADGELRVFAGSLDVTDLFAVSGTVLRSDPSIAALPSGQHELIV